MSLGMPNISMQDAIEYGANFFYVLSTFFVSRNSLHTWWTGIISCSLFIVTFYHARLYADVSLQCFYIGTCIYGWWHWKNGDPSKKQLPITHIQLKYFFLMLICAALVAIGYGSLLFYFTNASYPFWDSAILTLAICGQFLVMKRKFENWYIWLVVDTLSIPLYFIKDLKLTALLYCGLLILGIYGYFTWKKELKNQNI
jgi:nicotinamide mononucleotide transporter